MDRNISRWLRTVRPRTDADSNWTSTPEAGEMLAAVHRRIETRARVRRVGWRLWTPVGVIAAAATVLTLVLTNGSPHTSGTVGAVPAGTGAAKPVPPAIRPAAMLLTKASSCADLLGGLRAHAAASVGPYGLPGTASPYVFDTPAPGLASAPAAAASAATSVDTSTTNVQELGVDEPDIVKTAGDRVVTITDGVLRVLDAHDQKVTGSLDLRIYVGWQNAQLLVGGDHALVILDDSYGGVVYRGPLAARVPGRSTTTQSNYLFVDLSGQPKITGSMQVAGSYVDARLIGSTVRLVASSAPTVTFPAATANTATSVAANRAIVRAMPLSDWLPRYTITSGAHTDKYTVPCSQVSHPADYTGASMLTIYTLDLTHLGSDPMPVSVAADGDTVYATSSSLYIASNPSWYCCASAAITQNTEVHRFDISGSTQPIYLGSGSVSGRLLSQYSLSDYAGSLRIATTIGGEGATPQSNSVYVLNADTLKVTGQLGGLGKGEQIYAVRFLGPVAYVVTFRQTDPLYVLDLRDPAAPKVVGSLQLTGYSNYLHDAGDGRLIGVGQEASAAGRVSGLQVSLFDVNNLAAPSRTGHVVLTDAVGESTIDPHAFLYWQPTGLIVVPVQSWTQSESGKVLVLKLSGTTLTEVGALANPLAADANDDGLGIQRSLIVDGKLWTVSGGGVQVSDQSTLTRQAWVPFD